MMFQIKFKRFEQLSSNFI